jgi:hypothetical protein
MNVLTDNQLTTFYMCLLLPVSGSWAMWTLQMDVRSSFKVSAITAVSKCHISQDLNVIHYESLPNSYQHYSNVEHNMYAQSGHCKKRMTTDYLSSIQCERQQW